MNGKLLPFGYSTPNAQATLDRLMEDKRAVLVDIRFKPYSQRPEWQGVALQAKWGKRYRPLGGVFGNKNYNNDKPIELVAPYTGWKIIKPWLEAGHDLVLICACKEASHCHRTTVVDYIREQMPDIEIEDEEMKPFNVWRPMKGFLPALSIQQPWCTLIAQGVKDIENRDWKTTYRGPILLHAGKKLDPACFDGENLHSPAIYRAGVGPAIRGRIPLFKSDYQNLTGGIIGIAELVDVVEKSDSPWFLGKYGFVLANARPLSFVAYRGALGLFSVSESILKGIDETTLRAQNIPHIPPPALADAHAQVEELAKLEAAKAKPKVDLSRYWMPDANKATLLEDVKPRSWEKGK